MSTVSTAAEGDDGAKLIDSVKMKSKIHYYLRTCSTAVKKARTFEVQRTVKKLKSCPIDNDKRGLEGQLKALKSSNHVLIAAVAIRSKLAKAKLLPKGQEGDEDVKELEGSFPLLEFTKELQDSIKAGQDAAKGEEDTEMEKAKAKLLSNKTVAEEVSRTVKEISSLLIANSAGSSESKYNADKKKKKDLPSVSSVEESDLDGLIASNSDDEAEMSEKKGREIGDSPHPKPSSAQMEEKQSMEAGQGRPSILKKNAKRQAGSADKEEERPRKQIRSNSDNVIASDQDDDEYYSGEDYEEEDQLSGHLPALSTGFVAGRGFRLGRNSEDDEWSDGDADLESIDEDADEAGRKKDSKKNRMGQRARRAIWEKKFGKQANHIKLLEKEPKQSKKMGEESFKVVRGKARPPRPDSGWNLAPGRPAPTEASTVSKVVKPKDDVEMHPSWIAKQKQKEREEAARRGEGMAKKIVFD